MEDANILMVEDELGVQALLIEILERGGIAVPIRLAGDGGAALACARERWAPVVVLDLTLPGLLDGWQVWGELKTLAGDRPLRVLLFTGTLNSAGEARAKELGAYSVVKKPVSPRQLLAEVRHALESL